VAEARGIGIWLASETEGAAGLSGSLGASGVGLVEQEKIKGRRTKAKFIFLMSMSLRIEIDQTQEIIVFLVPMAERRPEKDASYPCLHALKCDSGRRNSLQKVQTS